MFEVNLLEPLDPNKPIKLAVFDQLRAELRANEDVIPIVGGVGIPYQRLNFIRAKLAPAALWRSRLLIPEIVLVLTLGQVFRRNEMLAKRTDRHNLNLAHQAQLLSHHKPTPYTRLRFYPMCDRDAIIILNIYAMTRISRYGMEMTNNTRSYYAGLDIGGSTVKSILLNDQGEQVGALVEVPSHVLDGYQSTFKQLELALDQLAEGAGVPRSAIGGVGLDVPAPSSDGVVWYQANLGADWVGTNICEQLSERIKVPVTMTNDGNAAGLGEYAARPHLTKAHAGGLLLVAPGTGLGGGLVLPNGTAYIGKNGLALEVGHFSVPFREEDGTLPMCSCGKKGCLEAWVSLVALRRRLGLELAKEKWAEHALNST